MHDVLISVVLGIIEGLTEFLPVSSTAHLRIAQHFMNIAADDPYWKMFAIVIQLGAVLCLPVYFWGRIVRLLKTFPRNERNLRAILRHPISLIMIAFVCTAIPAFLLKKVISANLENFTVMGASLVIGGAVMWAVDAVCGAGGSTDADQDDPDSSPTALDVMQLAASNSAQPPVVEYATPTRRVGGTTHSMEQMSLIQAVWIGLIQILSAVFPGTSRSMATIAAGQTAGLNRATALEFSFFLSMPTMAVATLYDLYKAIRPGHDAAGLAPLHMTGHGWFLLGIGFVVSFIIALGVVAWFMHWVRRRGFVPFAIYRIIAGLLVLVLMRHG